MIKDKVAVITGSGRGIGKAIAVIFAKNGAKVVINDKEENYSRKTLEEIKALGAECIFVKADISKKEEVDDLFRKTIETFGRVDILINNAGILKNSLLLMTSEQDYDLMMNVNLKGTYLCMQRAAKIMIKQKKGKIINISSITGRYGVAGNTAYSASKAGVIGLTLSAAKELGNFGITVNTVAPGVINTDLIAGLKEDIKSKFIDSIALKRLGEPEDIAKVVLFLASNQSDYINGQIIGVDGCQIM